jgi:septum formation protein
MLNHLSEYEIILGSGSPRRYELLKTLGLKFKVIKSNNDEIVPPELDLTKVPEYLALEKANDLKLLIPYDAILITADTIVIKDNIILGKPLDQAEAINMVLTLADDVHEVITGVSISQNDYNVSFSDSTMVYFAPISREEAEYYVLNNNVLDKAGAYGIQDWVGLVKIDKIIGSYYNVMGLPIHKVYRELLHFGKANPNH